MLRALLLFLILFAPASARAAESAPVASPRATATLLADRAAIAPGESFRLMLHLALARGWHSYWTNAGDAGAAPELTVTLPEGWSAGALQFPAPQRIAFGPLMNFGYTGEAGFLLPLTAPATLRPGERVTLEAEASWLVCADVCIPEEGRFALTLPVEAAPRPANLARFLAAEAALPREAPFAARFARDGPRAVLSVTGEGLSPASLREAAFFPLAPNLIENPAPQRLAAREGGFTLTLTPGPAPWPGRLEGVLTLTDAAGVRGAYLIRAEPGGPLPSPGLPLWQILGLALLGGLVLNLMPCVFPVLAMKAMALAKLSGAARGAVRAEALGYTLGVLAGFLAIAGLMLGLRAAGAAAGWGFQFTWPAFVAGMAWLMLAVGLNLSGVFHLRGPSLAGGHLGSFGTGLLAVVVATPCTAPFMATAIGAALTLPWVQVLGVFAAMGLGLALPYALLGAFPALARVLPRPGAWMERLRQFLAFPMYGAAAWLVWVLAQQTGPDGVLTALAGGVLIGLAAWAYGAAQASGGAGRLGRAMAALAVLGALALLPLLSSAPPASAAVAAHAEPWSPARVAELRAEGRPVFVNLTAAWCISCKVNERIAIQTEATQAAMREANVAQLTGDWTRGEPAITALLREHGRDGVPLYLLYPAGGGAPAVLPQILTESILRAAIAEARGGR
ncbi:protein-disulfide reductase DsbD family protein [Rubritepida flocculans]|uniref:protein-disulfide reductase DsbD family protein n=1 Tax=Rubritepida flocculans TaxID=182403 RepID=UPI0003FCB052|nr:protein-disulfide reductase DsbD domain-containing protein [Rubritepida flocculans]